MSNKDLLYEKETKDLKKVIEEKSNEYLRLEITKNELEKSNVNLKEELNRMKSKLNEHKQSSELESLDSIRKVNELKAKLSSLEKENEIQLKLNETLYQDISKKYEQVLLEKQELTLSNKALKERHTIEIETKDQNNKLELERTSLKHTSELNRLEQIVESKVKDNEQLLLESQILKKRVNELEHKILIDQSNNSLNDEKKGKLKLQLAELEQTIKDKGSEIKRYKDKSKELEALNIEKEEEIAKLKGKNKALDREMMMLKDTHRAELEEYRRKVKEEQEERVNKLEETCKKLKEENTSLKMQSTKRLIPFIEEPYEPVHNEDRLFELETENHKLKTAVVKMRTEMEKIRDEVKKDLTLPLIKEKELNEPQELLRYKGELQKKEGEVQQMSKA